MIDQLPAPNATGAGDGLNTAAYRFNSRNNEFRDQFVFKSDYYLSPRHSFTGTFNYINNPTDRPEQGSYYTTIPTVSNTIENYFLALSWRWAVSPTFTNELRGGFLRSDTSFLNNTDYTPYIAAGLVFTNPYNTFLQQGRKVNTYISRSASRGRLRRRRRSTTPASSRRTRSGSARPIRTDSPRPTSRASARPICRRRTIIMRISRASSRRPRRPST
jgi:hypothetical protein